MPRSKSWRRSERRRCRCFAGRSLLAPSAGTAPETSRSSALPETRMGRRSTSSLEVRSFITLPSQWTTSPPTSSSKPFFCMSDTLGSERCCCRWRRMELWLMLSSVTSCPRDRASSVRTKAALRSLTLARSSDAATFGVTMFVLARRHRERFGRLP